MASKEKIKGKFELEIKRFYIPLVLNFECPYCSHKVKTDLNQDYLSYPTLNKFEFHAVYCDNCEEYSEFDIKLKLEIEYTDIKKS